MNKKLVIGLVILSVVALGFSIFNFVRPMVQPVQTTQPVPTEVGAMPGSSLPGPAFSVGGVEKYFYHLVGRYSTNTPASIKCPTATSTIENLTFNINKADATANYYDFATSTTMYATTSVFANLTTSASTKYNKVYLEIAGGSECAPNTYIVVKAAKADVGSSTLNVILRKSN